MSNNYIIIIMIIIIFLNETLLKVVKAQLQRKAFKQLKVEKEQISKQNLFYNKYKKHIN